MRQFPPRPNPDGAAAAKSVILQGSELSRTHRSACNQTGKFGRCRTVNAAELKALRESIGTQEQVSNLVGYSVRTIARWESDGGAGPAVEGYMRMLEAIKNSKPSSSMERRLRALAFGERDDDPLADVADYDQAVHDLRNLRAGRAAEKFHPRATWVSAAPSAATTP